MIHTYTISGMTCGNCVATVEKALLDVDQIDDADANLESSSVTIHTNADISLEKLQKALPSKYKISKTDTKNVFANNTTSKEAEQSEWKQLFPLFLIFAYLFAASILLNKNLWSVQNFMLDFMGLFYIVFSFFKFLDYKGFPQSFRMYDPLAKAIPFYGWLYPFLELALGLLFLMRLEIPLALIATLIILGITTVGVARTLLKKNAIQCACLGTALKLPMTKATLIENSIMIVMAIVMLLKTYN
ncbi:heavy-metal-associated domain-containing protein [Psychroserpens sp. XS_ASV72]|uniref:heavy-metal-associated domain-containing protein n=1 Tax=Psychroserpens sp. XS_ASV72 TaxID=3241293 RepID=UPI00351970BC